MHAHGPRGKSKGVSPFDPQNVLREGGGIGTLGIAKKASQPRLRSEFGLSYAAISSAISRNGSPVPSATIHLGIYLMSNVLKLTHFDFYPWVQASIARHTATP